MGLVEKAHAFAGLEVAVEQRVGRAARAAVELDVAALASAVAQRAQVGMLAGTPAQDLGNRSHRGLPYYPTQTMEDDA